MHNTHIGGCFWRTKITRKASDVAENLQLYKVVQFFHPKSSCATTHILADIHRITANIQQMYSWANMMKWNIKCVVHDDLGWKNQITRYILQRHWLYEWLSQFHSCGTYSVLSFTEPSFILNHVFLIMVFQYISCFFSRSFFSFASPQIIRPTRSD